MCCFTRQSLMLVLVVLSIATSTSGVQASLETGCSEHISKIFNMVDQLIVLHLGGTQASFVKSDEHQIQFNLSLSPQEMLQFQECRKGLSLVADKQPNKQQQGENTRRPVYQSESSLPNAGQVTFWFVMFSIHLIFFGGLINNHNGPMVLIAWLAVFYSMYQAYRMERRNYVGEVDFYDQFNLVEFFLRFMVDTFFALVVYIATGFVELFVGLLGTSTVQATVAHGPFYGLLRFGCGIVVVVAILKVFSKINLNAIVSAVFGSYLAGAQNHKQQNNLYLQGSNETKVNSSNHNNTSTIRRILYRQ